MTTTRAHVPGRTILLLDFDHTLYPSTVNTLKAVDDRINLYIRTFLGFTSEQADATRTQLWDKYGTTLKGLEELHGVEREHYCDFIHAVEDAHLPPPDPALQAWLARLPHPTYIFTNARMDWAIRGLRAMGLGGLLPANPALGNPQVTGALGLTAVDSAASETTKIGATLPGPRLGGIFDIAFMDWPVRNKWIAELLIFAKRIAGPAIPLHHGKRFEAGKACA